MKRHHPRLLTGCSWFESRRHSQHTQVYASGEATGLSIRRGGFDPRHLRHTAFRATIVAAYATSSAGRSGDLMGLIRPHSRVRSPEQTPSSSGRGRGSSSLPSDGRHLAGAIPAALTILEARKAGVLTRFEPGDAVHPVCGIVPHGLLHPHACASGLPPDRGLLGADPAGSGAALLAR